jgi:putative peptide zinc metalloprotease protein
MDRAEPTSDLDRRKQVRLCLRGDLALTSEVCAGGTFYVVKDPVSMRYFRFDEYDYFLIRRLDGSRTLDEIRKAFERRYRPRRLTLEALEQFGQTLLKEGLAAHALPQAGKQLYERGRRRLLFDRLRSWTNVLYMEFPLFEPDALLGRVVRRLSWVFTRGFLIVSLLFLLSTLLLALTHWETLNRQMPSLREFFGVRHLVALWLTLGAVKVVHELSHGLACKAFGGRVHDAGFLLMCLTPCLYLNVSEAWTFRSKWRRMAVGAAGVYAELLLAATAVLVRLGSSGPIWMHHLCLDVIVICSINTLLFNGNPLLRFDGYYVLADWLEVPNLRDQCNQYLRQTVVRFCLGVETPPVKPMEVWRRVLFVVYAVASYIYGWVVMLGVLWFISRFLAPYKLGAVSMGLALLSIASMIGWPLFELARSMYQQGGLPKMKPLRTTVSLCVLTAALLAFFFLPLPVSRVRQTALVECRPEAVDSVFVTIPSRLEVLHIRDGQRVREGEVLAEFSSLDMDYDRESARSEYDIRTVQVRALRRLAAQTTEPQEKARMQAAVTQTEGERKVFAAQVALNEGRRQRLKLRAPRAGVVFGAPRPEEVGRTWERGRPEPFCSIGDPKKLRLLMPVSPADYRLLQQDLGPDRDLAVTVRVQGWGHRTWDGQVAPLPQMEAREVPLPLTKPGGGPVAVLPGNKPGPRVPQSQQYLVAIDLHDADAGIVPGTLAQAKVHCRWRSAAWWTWRELAQLFDVGLI